MTALVEKTHAMAALVSEQPGFYCREEITIGASQTLEACSVVGMIPSDTGTVTVGAPSIVGTGNGVLTRATPAYGAGVQEGTYRVNCIGATTDVNDFEVVRPDGTVDGTAKTGVAYDGQIKFTIADGSQDYTVGSHIDLVVTIADAATAGEYFGHDPSASTGIEHAAAVILYPVTTGAAETKTVTAWVRGPVELRASDLVWPHTGITADEKAAAAAELAALGIILR